MLQLINRFVDICLLRRGPQDLPTSTFLTGLCILAYFGLATGSEVILGKPERALTWGLAAIAIMLAVVYGLLAYRRVPSRFPQTTSALAGCGALYLMIYLPLSAALISEPGQASAMSSFLFLTWVVVFFWGFLIEGHIYRHALSISLPAGVLVSTLMFALVTVIYHGIFGAQG